MEGVCSNEPLGAVGRLLAVVHAPSRSLGAMDRMAGSASRESRRGERGAWSWARGSGETTCACLTAQFIDDDDETLPRLDSRLSK
jgi:hypothetical protein